MRWTEEHTAIFAEQVDRNKRQGYDNVSSMTYALDRMYFDLYQQAYNLGNTVEAVRKVIFNAMER